MASLRARGAYLLAQADTRMTNISAPFGPVRLSVVVSVRRNPTSVCWPSVPPTGPSVGVPFPPRGLVGPIPPLHRYYGALRFLVAHPSALRCLRTAVPSEHLRIRSVGRQVLRPRPRAVGEPVPASRRSLGWRRRGLPGSRETHPHACHALRPRQGRCVHGHSDAAMWPSVQRIGRLPDCWPAVDRKESRAGLGPEKLAVRVRADSRPCVCPQLTSRTPAQRQSVLLPTGRSTLGALPRIDRSVEGVARVHPRPAVC